MMEDLGDVVRNKKKKELQILKSDAFQGSVKYIPTSQRYYETINDYLYHNRCSKEVDSDLLRVGGALMKGTDWDWYNNYAPQLQSNRKIDS